MNTFLRKNIVTSPVSLLVLCGLMIIPSVLGCFWGLSKLEQIHRLQERLSLFEGQWRQKEGRKKEEERALQKIHQAKKGYLQEHVESLSFLEEERRKWQMFAGQNRSMEPDKNKLQFMQQERRQGDLFAEIEWKQSYPVEMNEQDVCKVLSLLEEGEGAPQLLIKSFELEKKEALSFSERVYKVSMDLMAREVE